MDILHERFYPNRGSLKYARVITRSLQSSPPDFDPVLLASLDIAQSRRLSSFLKYAVSELNSINGHLGQAGVGAATRFRELRALNENADDFLQRVALQYGLTRGVLAAGLAQLHQAIAAATDLITRFNEEPTAVRHLFTAFTSAGPLE
ncbi:hypothetical protein CFC21_054340 [Triticum aestivum]|uniref:Uncharacterized protein n=3 Tax=Triticum aestivum TaxID=4565 RepID=A0A3B6I2U0_WHEAT|nr:hypothetical protein CFC21_054340 [Triticum aestivum]